MPYKSLGNLLEVTPFLNLYGLTPYQFRLFAHIVRRSQKNFCTSTLEKMAVVCRMGERTARAAMGELLKNGMIIKQERYNDTNQVEAIHNAAQWTMPTETWQEKGEIGKNLMNDREYAREDFIHRQESLFRDLGKRKTSIFVHGFLDLYGLDPYEFRVLAHIACEKESERPVETIAAICMMSSRKVQTTLKRLLELGLISKEEKKGRPSTYELEPVIRWKPPIQKWENPRTVARLKKTEPKDETDLICWKPPEDSLTPLQAYQHRMEKYYQELSREFDTIVKAMEQEEEEEGEQKVLTHVQPQLI